MLDNGDRETSAEDDLHHSHLRTKGQASLLVPRTNPARLSRLQMLQIRHIGMETLYIGAASTDANIPISLGIPAITVGWGGKGGGEHTIHEWYEHCRILEGPTARFAFIIGIIWI